MRDVDRRGGDETEDSVSRSMTIDEVARAGDVVVSTVRMYQHRGLLHGPTKRGRVGFYDATHLQRLRAIAQLQARGFSLASIKELLDGVDAGGSLQSIVGVDRATVWSAEAAVTMSLTELATRVPGFEFTPAGLQRVLALGLIDIASDGVSVTVNSPSFLRVGGELASLGVPGDVILDEYEQLRVHADAIAQRFAALFEKYLWQPFVAGGQPAEAIAPLVALLDKLSSLATDVTLAALRQSLQRAAEVFVTDEAHRLGVGLTPRHGGEDA
jgi:DNA-binding transcriptional MerR regulator